MKKLIEIAIAICVMAALAGTALAGIGTVSVGLTETTVLPADAYRKWIILQNNNINDVYVKIDSSATALTTTNGLKLAANGGTLTLTSSANANPARNTIRAISGAGTNLISYQSGNESPNP